MFNENTAVGKRMNTLVTIFAVILIVFLGINTIRSLGGREHKGGAFGGVQNTITVSGKDEVIAIPDIATISFSVVEQAKTVSEAQEKATTKMNNALGVVKGLGIEEKDIKTTDYSAYPRYEYLSQICTAYSCPPSTQNLVGYEVRQSIMIKIRNIADAGKVLSAIGTTGVSDISGLNFEVDDQDARVREARKIAIDDAREQAKQLAKDLGVKLSDIVSFNESGNYPTPMYYAKDMAMGMGGANESAPQLPTGESKITSNVTITYEIK